MITIKRALLTNALMVTGLILTACGGSSNNSDNPDNPTYRYSVKVVNTTNNQPLSPVAIIAHDNSYSGWAIGSAASGGLAVLAESGSPADLLVETESLSVSQTSGTAPVGPGGDATLEIEVGSLENLEITVASMLVNTNDAFTGTTGWSVGDLAVGESKTTLTPVYDAGTEVNDELAAYIPGPVASGEGVSEGREDNDFVTRHPGVVTTADGYEESALDESHRFDNGAMLVTVTRLE